MKLTSGIAFVRIESENNYDTFQIGQLAKDIQIANLRCNVLVSSESQANLSIKNEDFIAYLIHKVEQHA